MLTLSERTTTFLERSGLDAEMAHGGEIRDLGDGTYVMIRKLFFHWMMVRGDFDDLIGYFDRWCYADEAGARAALRAFPETPAPGYEPEGWHRHPPTRRRRPDGDASREYLEG